MLLFAAVVTLVAIFAAFLAALITAAGSPPKPETPFVPYRLYLHPKNLNSRHHGLVPVQKKALAPKEATEVGPTQKKI